MVRLEGERVVLRPLGQDELDAVLAARDRLRSGGGPAVPGPASGSGDASGVRGGCCAATSTLASRRAVA